MWYPCVFFLGLGAYLAESYVFRFVVEAGSQICCHIAVIGYGGDDERYQPGKTSFIVNGVQFEPKDYPLVGEGEKVRGVHLMILSTGHNMCVIKDIRTYDTFQSTFAATTLGIHLDETTQGDFVVGISEDDASHHLSLAKQSLESQGVRLKYSNYDFNSSWYRSVFGFIFRKGSPESVSVNQLKRRQGPLLMDFSVPCSVVAPVTRGNLDHSTSTSHLGRLTTSDRNPATSGSFPVTVALQGTPAYNLDTTPHKGPPDQKERTLVMLLYISCIGIAFALVVVLVATVICYKRHQRGLRNSP